MLMTLLSPAIMSKNSIQTLLLRFETSLDKFFDAQGKWFNNQLETLFTYVYRETHKGVFGLFNTPEAIIKAAREAREAGYANIDCLTPFPVHGLETAMGLERSRLPYVTFFAGFCGLLLGFTLQAMVHEEIFVSIFTYFDAFANLRSYPLNIGGKPSFSWPAMVPICFELTILLGGHITVASLLVLTGLYKPARPILHPSITQDKFCLWIPEESEHFHQEKVQAFFERLDASDITAVHGKEKKVLPPLSVSVSAPGSDEKTEDTVSTDSNQTQDDRQHSEVPEDKNNA